MTLPRLLLAVLTASALVSLLGDLDMSLACRRLGKNLSWIVTPLTGIETEFRQSIESGFPC